MEMAKTLTRFLADHHVNYDKIPHRHTATSLRSAHVANVPSGQMAKPVILEDDQGYVMAVVPASRNVKIRELNRVLRRKMGLATEAELAHLFADCEIGAIPPIGQAYGLTTIVDNSLDECGEIYFEAGNHEELICIKGSAFRELMRDTQHANICMH